MAKLPNDSGSILPKKSQPRSKTQEAARAQLEKIESEHSHLTAVNDFRTAVAKDAKLRREVKDALRRFLAEQFGKLKWPIANAHSAEIYVAANNYRKLLSDKSIASSTQEAKPSRALINIISAIRKNKTPRYSRSANDSQIPLWHVRWHTLPEATLSLISLANPGAAIPIRGGLPVNDGIALRWVTNAVAHRARPDAGPAPALRNNPRTSAYHELLASILFAYRELHGARPTISRSPSNGTKLFVREISQILKPFFIEDIPLPKSKATMDALVKAIMKRTFLAVKLGRQK